MAGHRRGTHDGRAGQRSDATAIRPEGNVGIEHPDERVEVRAQHGTGFTDYVTNIDYNEKGQRTKVEYGNGVTTTTRVVPVRFCSSR